MIPLSRATADLLERLAATPDRVVLGVAGAPGAGKSTASEAVRRAAEDAGVATVVVGMDGWHLAHSVLEARGQTDVKGSPETFDAHGFVDAVKRVHHQGPGQASIWLPQFRREIEDAIAGAIEVRGEHRLVIVEGNYLYLDEQPWTELRDLFDAAWFLMPSERTRQERLIARHEFHGRDPQDARERALGSDELNARRVLAGAETPDVMVVDPG